MRADRVYVSDCYAGLAAGALIAAGEQTAENLRGLGSDAIARTGIQGDFCRSVTCTPSWPGPPTRCTPTRSSSASPRS